jgi:hypothetical protein
MVFKVSFKDGPKDPCKYAVVSGRKVGIVVSGTVVFPEFWKNVPDEIIDWMRGQNHLISGDEDIATNTFHLKAVGFARCHEDDKFDYVFGERLAEARAKYKIYKFFYGLTCKLYDYYRRILFGDEEVVDMGKGSCLAQDIKKYEALCIREAHHIGELLKNKDNE